MLGAALGAGVNAAAQLDFDQKNPTAAGPPHVSQTGGDADALAQDCADEKIAFIRLESRRQALQLEPVQVLAAASMQGANLPMWQARLAGPTAGCS